VSCPGYEKTFKFVDRAHRRPQKSCNSNGTSAQEDVETVTPTKASSAIALNSTDISMVVSSRHSGSTLTTRIYSPSIHQVQCLSTWIEDVSRSRSSIPDQITIAQLFCFIPSRLGRSRALDLAVRCLTVHHLGVTECSEQIIRHGRFDYGKALCSLQKAVYDPVEAMRSETLCATMILCIYEVDCI
jgi:hypothetical protein